MTSPQVVLRADGGDETGHGHVMRCLTLGQALAENGLEVCLVSKDLPASLRARAVQANILVHDMESAPYGPADARHLLEFEPQLVVVDGYRFGDLFFREVSSNRLKHVLIDDNAEVSHRTASLIVNQNPHAGQISYEDRPKRTEVLRGLQYALIRPEILEAFRAGESHRVGVLVSVGGTDQRGLACDIGGQLEQRLGVQRVRPDTRADGIIEIAGGLASAEIAVVGGGTTLWEALFLGVPAIAVVVADNQARGAEALRSADLIDVVDLRFVRNIECVTTAVEALYGNPEKRRRRAMAGRRAVDGLGPVRVTDRILALMSEP